jgi:hypothetical protein
MERNRRRVADPTGKATPPPPGRDEPMGARSAAILAGLITSLGQLDEVVKGGRAASGDPFAFWAHRPGGRSGREQLAFEQAFGDLNSVEGRTLA